MPTTSPNMNLVVPTPSNGTTGTGDPGPLYAQEISNDLLVTIDQHNHTSGNGVPIPVGGLSIQTDLPINSNNVTLVRAVRYVSQASGLNGVGDISEVYVLNGNLWYNNSSGQAIQITSGSSVVNPGSNLVLPYQAVAANWIIANSDTYILLNVNTTAARSITLPAANSVTSGRWYVIADASGLAGINNITISTVGSDTISGGSFISIQANYGCAIIASNGNNGWSVINNTPATLGSCQAGITGMQVAGLANGVHSYQIQYNGLSATTGQSVSQPVTVGSGSSNFIVNTNGLYEISYKVAFTSPTGSATGTMLVYQTLNATGALPPAGVGTMISSSINQAVYAGSPQPYTILNDRYLVALASGTNIQTWTTGLMSEDTYLSPTGTSITIKQVA